MFEKIKNNFKKESEPEIKHYIKAKMPDGEDLFIGPYKSDSARITAHRNLINARSEGKIYGEDDKIPIKFEDFDSNDDLIEPINEREFFDRASEDN